MTTPFSARAVRVTATYFDWDCLMYGGVPMVPPTTGEVTTCKHGPGACDLCGTSPNNDRRHTTIHGKGAVARLRVRSSR